MILRLSATVDIRRQQDLEDDMSWQRATRARLQAKFQLASVLSHTELLFPVMPLLPPRPSLSSYVLWYVLYFRSRCVVYIRMALAGHRRSCLRHGMGVARARSMGVLDV